MKFMFNKYLRLITNLFIIPSISASISDLINRTSHLNQDRSQDVFVVENGWYDSSTRLKLFVTDATRCHAASSVDEYVILGPDDSQLALVPEPVLVPGVRPAADPRRDKLAVLVVLQPHAVGVRCLP